VGNKPKLRYRYVPFCTAVGPELYQYLFVLMESVLLCSVQAFVLLLADLVHAGGHHMIS
jgi:hypothetical protein